MLRIPERAIVGAKNYALADKSNPFAFNVAMSHTLNGIASIDPNGNDAYYTAEAYSETRQTPEGEEYKVTAYKNMKRP